MAKTFRNTLDTQEKKEKRALVKSDDIIYHGIAAVTPTSLWSYWNHINGSAQLRKADPNGYKKQQFHDDFSPYGFQRFWIGALSLVPAGFTSYGAGQVASNMSDSGWAVAAAAIAGFMTAYTVPQKIHSKYHLGRLRAEDPSRRLEHKR